MASSAVARRHRAGIAVLTLATLAATTLTACNRGGGDSSAGGDTLIASTATEPSTLDPQLVNDRSTRIVTDNVFETLLARDASAKIRPALATAYKPTDEKTWRFTLRKGVKFHDGTAFTADDVVFSIKRIINPDFNTQRASYTEGITGATKVDAQTVDVISESTNPVLPAEVTSIPIVSRKSGATKGFGQSVVVGTGPYKFLKWNRGESVSLTRYDDYWGAKPSIKNFRVRVIPDAQTQLSSLQTGEIDLMLDLLPEQAKLAPKVREIRAADFSYIAFNTYKKELKSPLVRQAMNYAVDKELIAKTLYGGHARPNQAQNLDSRMLGFNAAVTSFPYDPAKAKSLLRQAGYPSGFSVDLHVPISRYSKGEETVELIAQEYAKVGIKAKVVKSEWNSYREAGRVSGTKSGAFDLKYGWNSNEWFDAARITAHVTCDGPSSKFCDKRVDSLMQEGLTTLDQKKRQTIYASMWSRLHEDPYSVYLLQQNYLYGTSKRVVWTPRPDDVYLVATMKLTK